jgi:formylglycine-generating enzyme required for sulfatase activity
MHGNLWEWCSDWHCDYPSRDVTDPKGPSVGKERVHRGGCYLVEGVKCRSAARNWDPPWGVWGEGNVSVFELFGGYRRAP